MVTDNKVMCPWVYASSDVLEKVLSTHTVRVHSFSIQISGIERFKKGMEGKQRNGKGRKEMGIHCVPKIKTCIYILVTLLKGGTCTCTIVSAKVVKNSVTQRCM